MRFVQGDTSGAALERVQAQEVRSAVMLQLDNCKFVAVALQVTVQLVHRSYMFHGERRCKPLS